MFSIFFLLFIALVGSLLLVPLQLGSRGIWAKRFRIFVTVLGLGIFSCYFISKSLPDFRKDALSIQVINKLPLPLDFYFVQVDGKKSKNLQYKTKNLGVIRSNYYRLEYLDANNADEVWVVAFLGKKNMVYFSQQSLASKNEDRKIEINNYLNQSTKLSGIAKTQIEILKSENTRTAIWIVLDFLLLFLHSALLVRKSFQKKIPKNFRDHYKN
jgi:hypothetical protein